jgi:hypothetical protein
LPLKFKRTVLKETGACKMDSEGSTSHGNKQKDKGRGERKKVVHNLCKMVGQG